jgi:hypothetical protein
MKINLNHASAIISQLLVAEAHAQDNWRDSDKLMFAHNRITTAITELEIFIENLDTEYEHYLQQREHIAENRMKDEDSDGTCSDALCQHCI